MAAHQAAVTQSGGEIVLAGTFAVDPTARLPDFDAPTAQAFEAREGNDHDGSLYALICGDELPPRIDALDALTGITLPMFKAPLAWSIAPWPPTGEERFVIVFERPLGNRIQVGTVEKPTPLREERLTRTLVRPFIQLLTELSRRGMTHRAIRVQNLFAGDPAAHSFVIGECVSGPPGIAQPALYETIERGMATAAGRGDGRIADDIYAFGVLTMTLALGHPLCPGWSDQRVIEAKIETGSYAALLGRERVPLGLMEPLRGLLCDNEDDRWGIEELERWLDGRTSTPKQVMLPAKAQRAFRFEGRDFRNLRSLAHAFALNWTEAAAAIQQGDLDKWVQRSLSNDPQASAIEHAFASISVGGEGSRTRDQMIFRILVTLDPTAPLRYKDVICVIDAFGQALAIGFVDPDLRKSFHELIRRRILQAWIEHQPTARREHGALKRKLNRLSSFLERSGPGFGLERCVYFMNPRWPCQSTLFRGVIVYELSQLLPALERAAASAGPGDEPVDRHIAAFCAANMKMVPPQVLKDLDDANEDSVRCLAMLALLAEVQEITGPSSLPALASWLVRLLEERIEAVHNLPYRSALGQEVAKATRSGHLGTLYRLIDNRPARQRDSVGFAQAEALFQQSESEIAWLEEDGLTNDAHVTRGAQQAAVLVSAILSSIALVTVTLAQVL